MAGPSIALVPAYLESSCDKVVGLGGGGGGNRGGLGGVSATRGGAQSVLSVPSSQRSSSGPPNPPSQQISSTPSHISRHFEVNPADAVADVVQMSASHDSLARSSEGADMRLLRPRGAAHRERDIERVAAPDLSWAPLANGFAPSWAVVGRVCRYFYSVSSAMRNFCVSERTNYENQRNVSSNGRNERARFTGTPDSWPVAVPSRRGDATPPAMWGCGITPAGRSLPYKPMRFVGSPASARIAASATS